MINNCPICLSESLSHYGDDAWLIDDTSYTLRQCSSCGSAFTDPIPDDAALTKLYKTSFDYRWYKDHILAKNKDARIRYNEYKSYLGNEVLDYGGGLGYFSKVCRAHGHQSLTYDPLSMVDISSRKWDTIVALHVLEHINELNRVISSFKTMLKKGGKLIIAVPNFNGDGYKTQGMQWVWAQPPLVHIYHFTALGLTDLLSRHGFIDLEVSYHERWDANLFCDVINADRFRARDARWGSKRYNSSASYRKVIAITNSINRFFLLRKSLDNINNVGIRRAELQIVATAP